MSSLYTQYHPSQLLDESLKGRMHDPRNNSASNLQQQFHPNTPAESHHLSPFSSTTQTQSSSASPAFNGATPDESDSTLSLHYQSSDIGDDDPFFGVDFSNADVGTPSFLSNEHSPADYAGDPFSQSDVPQNPANVDAQTYPLSPSQTASIHTSSPPTEGKDSRGTFPNVLPQSISPQELTKAPKQDCIPLKLQTTSITPDTSGSNPSSDEGLVPPASAAAMRSPRLTVSMWGDAAGPIEEIAPAFHSDGGSPTTVRAGYSLDNSTVPSDVQGYAQGHAARDADGQWKRHAASGPRGLDPASRPTREVASANELDANRKSQERNQDVTDWLSRSEEAEMPQDESFVQSEGQPKAEGVPDREIATGDQTENVPQPGRTYYLEQGGQLTEEDMEIMRGACSWTDSPTLFHIQRPDTARRQPQTAAEAMRRFEKMCRDNDSILSRAATWGTRRRSLPSIPDYEGITSGNFLKKLSISRNDAPRRPSVLQGIRSLMRKPSVSQLRKRRAGVEEDESSSGPDSAGERRESKDSLAPPGHTTSWSKKQQPPSINTALLSMSQQVASIGTTHARNGSISTTPPVTSPPVTSPKSPFLRVANIRRPRSKSDLPTSHSNLVDMWKKSGGPPVAQLAKTSTMPEVDDDDDEDEDGFDDSEMKSESIELIDDITPNLEGFRQHILKCNPRLKDMNKFLVERIMYQQQQRYKLLCGARVKHLGHVQNKTCPCGPSLCIDLGGSANRLVNKNETRGIDPLDGSDDDNSPLDGAIAQESFPANIPMPPTAALPAEFECQLCFQAKKFQKPSDWTKHVHEDVQPFTCTWEKCRENKIFKRKADWVRHENEGHRHLEWWTCDVEDCRHVCYRRDNFLQHLVREHKFPEPKVKTKAAIKRAGGNDPTWIKVESCHQETRTLPQEEACRFCGSTFTTWKKLTVHLAKHMEQLSLPILRLVSRKELDADTLISPVQEPPPRNFMVTPVKTEPPPFPSTSPSAFAQPINNAMHQPYHGAPNANYMFPVQQPIAYTQPFYPNQFDGLPHTMPNIDTSMGAGHPVNPGFPDQQAFAGMTGIPVTTGSYMGGDASRYMPMAPNVEPFPEMPMNNALGLQNPSHQMQYNNMMDPGGAGLDQHYMAQTGSTSPFSHHSHSPHQGQGGSQFYSQ
ncbi:uncharacterized protein E0L32_009596 [Thyridium curvatum]|uniref:C2H2-type domain-containing protein n=1 Tax=Thyridium curvatum TaxID=1093900 RepID=A0A507AI83_9PEZI|nr:uncharacterized protein E0L32_009596 [Thyridium curvatum]TPX08892.1 hypothetical protein E0L32_009596 [Thyridium curvatum]